MRQVEISLGELAFQAEAGDPSAQYRLAVLFLLGESVEQDLNAAYLWMAKAASGRHQGAQMLIASLASCRTLAKPILEPDRRSMTWLPGLADRASSSLAATRHRVVTSVQSSARGMAFRLRQSLARKLRAKMPFQPNSEIGDFSTRHGEGLEIPEAL